MNNVLLGGVETSGRTWAFYETNGCGMGARPNADGIDAIHVHMTNTLNTPIEALERDFPLLVTRYEFAEGTGGAGHYRGGTGLVRGFALRAGTAVASLLAERHTVAPRGACGGEPGACGSHILRRNGTVSTLPAKTTLELMAGDEIIIQSAGGGGYGTLVEPAPVFAFKAMRAFPEQKVPMDQLPDVPGVVAPPPLIFGGGLALGLLANRVVRLPKPHRLVARMLGAALVAASLAYGPGAFVRMRRMKTNVDPYRPTTAIVESGPFRFSRNPLYVSLALLYAAIALLARATLPLVLLPAVLAIVQRGVISREERYLERKFGAAYLTYKSRVRRWL